MEREKRMDGKWVFTYRMNMKTAIRFVASCGHTIIGPCHTKKETQNKLRKIWWKKWKDGTRNPSQPVSGGQAPVQGVAVNLMFFDI